MELSERVLDRNERLARDEIKYIASYVDRHYGTIHKVDYTLIDAGVPPTNVFGDPVTVGCKLRLEPTIVGLTPLNKLWAILRDAYKMEFLWNEEYYAIEKTETTIEIKIWE